MANNKAEMIGINCWNAYIESNSQEPQTGTQFQRWISIHPSYRERVSYNKAYAIFDQYSGKGKVPVPDHQKARQNTKPLATRNVRVQLPQNNAHIHKGSKSDALYLMKRKANEQTRDAYYNTKRHDIYNHNVRNVRNAHNVQNVSHVPNVPNDSRSRTQSVQNKENKAPSAHRQRAHTCSSPEDLESAVRNMVFSVYKQKQHGPQLSASHNIKAVPLPPKVAQCELTEFLIRYDVRDLQPKLATKHIQLKHLQCMEASDINELCAHLELNISEKIRFTFALKDLLRRNNANAVSQNGLKQSQSSEVHHHMMPLAVLSDEECDDPKAYPMISKKPNYPKNHKGSKSDALYLMKRNKLNSNTMKHGYSPN